MLFPAYYVNWYDDTAATPEGRRKKTMQVWATMVQRSMKVALRWNRPVLPFIWMQYHDKLNQPVLATRFGVNAADAAHAGEYGMMVSLRGQDIGRVALADAVRLGKLVPQSRYDDAAEFFG